MNILFENLDTLIDAPNGIDKTRELILQLAVQGKLTEQDPKDEPASELLKKIKKEKEKLIAEGKIKKQKELPPIKDEDEPFELPQGWIAERLGNLSELINGVTYSKSESSDIPSDGYLPILRANNINGKVNFDKLIYVPKKRITANQLLKKFDNLIAMSSGSKSLVGKSAQLKEDFEGSFGAFCGVIRCNEKLNSEYVNYFLQSPYYREGIAKSSQGIGINNLRKDNLLQLIFPLPPSVEQKRIVEKVKSLMALLDELEEKRERRNQKRIKLNNASIKKLLTSKDDKELKTNWKRVAENFSTLYSVPENVEKLKQAILQLAVQGKLVKQDSNDEPASELLKKIKKEKEKLIAEGKIKKQKELPPIKDEDEPFELPKGWVFVRLNEITNVGTGATPSTDNQDYYKGDINWITSSATGKDFVLEPDKKISAKALEETNCQIYPIGTLIFALYGQGKTRGQITELMIPAATNQACAGIVIINHYLIERKYIKYFFKKQYEEIRELSYGGAQPNLNLHKLKNTIVPLPPLNEQKRIVEKVNELMSLCNALEEKLTKKEETSERLVGAGVNRISTNK